jgi:hypothetical protein
VEATDFLGPDIDNNLKHTEYIIPKVSSVFFGVGIFTLLMKL